jgi:hypothetical protein
MQKETARSIAVAFETIFRKKTNQRRLLAIGILILEITFALYFSLHFFSALEYSSLELYSSPSFEQFFVPPQLPVSTRSVVAHLLYPYSIIPNGVFSGKELRTVLLSDPIAAAHYADFRVESARAIHLNRATQFYVSYRLGNRIYWTAKKLTLPKGETILTDGEHALRSRCGNRISEFPAGPTSAAEPLAELTGAPFVPSRIDIPPESLPSQPVSWDELFGSPFVVALNSAPATATSGPGGTLIPPPFWCCGGSGTPGSNNPIPPPPPVVTPEPGTLVLLAFGMASIALLNRSRAR